MSNKSNVEIQITLQFENQYSGDGNTEPTREQVREALIDFANNNLTYSEKRTPISPEKGEAFDVHNDIVTGLYEQHDMNAILDVSDEIITMQKLSENYKPSPEWYLLHEEPVNNPLETFKDMDDAISQATHTAQKASESPSESEILQADLEPISHSIPQSHTTQILKASTLGRDSKEQGGNRSKNTYNTDRDPLNED